MAKEIINENFNQRNPATAHLYGGGSRFVAKSRPSEAALV